MLCKVVFTFLITFDVLALTAASSFDKTDLYVGDEFELTISLTKDDKGETFNDPPIPESPSFILQDIRKEEPSPTETIYKIKFIALKGGEVIFKDLPIKYSLGKDEKEILLRPENIKIQTSITQDTKPEEVLDIKGDKKIRNMLPYYILLGIILAGIFFYFIYKKLKGYKPKVKTPPPPSPFDHANKRLAELIAMGLIAKGEWKLFTFTLQEIFREYLEFRFDLQAIEATTHEIKHSLSRSHLFLDKEKAEVIKFLEDTDIVKFTKLIPENSSGDIWIRFVKQFIKRWKNKNASNP